MESNKLVYPPGDPRTKEMYESGLFEILDQNQTRHSKIFFGAFYRLKNTKFILVCQYDNFYWIKSNNNCVDFILDSRINELSLSDVFEMVDPYIQIELLYLFHILRRRMNEKSYT